MNVLQDLGVDRGKLRDTVIELARGGRAGYTPPIPVAHSRRRAARALSVEGSAPEGGFRVEPDDEVSGLLMSAAARASENGRTEMTVADLLIALARVSAPGRCRSQLGAGEAAIRAALERRGTADEPPGGRGS